MKKVIIVVSLSVFMLFVWAVWLARRPVNPYAQKTIGRKGAVYNVEESPNMFEIKGFTYYEKSPYRKRPLKAQKVWVFSNHSSPGKISIGGFQRARRKLKDVTVLVKFHISLQNPAYLTVRGTDMEKSEQVQEELPQDGDGYCTRVVFLGPVHEVSYAKFDINEPWYCTM